MCITRMSSSEDCYSCVVVEQKTIHITLPLQFTGNPFSGIRTIFDSWNKQYVPSLDGVLLSYGKITPKSKLGRVIADQPSVHYDVQSEFSVFRPTVGAILRGTINRISREHVGCVVHDCINVSIHHLTNLASDISELIHIGRTVLFKVTKVETLRKTLRIHGEISRKCYRLMRGELVNGVSNEGNAELGNETVNSYVQSSRTDGEEPSEVEIPQFNVVTKVEKETSGEEEVQVESYVKTSKKKRKKVQ